MTEQAPRPENQLPKETTPTWEMRVPRPQDKGPARLQRIPFWR